MKKAAVYTILTLIFILTLATQTFAASASATLTGPGTVRAGDTITLSFKGNGTSIRGFSGTLAYDSNQLEFVELKQKIAQPWMVDFSNSKFLAYDNNDSITINSETELFTVNFKVKNLAVGTNVAVSFNDIVATYSKEDIKVGSAGYSTSIVAPKSSNADLAGITVVNGTLTPAFNKNTLEYTVKVPYSVDKLNIACTAADSKATISLNNPTLKANAVTDITITVKAENGSTQVYTIKATREQDPNYTKSENNSLSSLNVEGFLLSPVFKTDITKYIVWLPYETASINVTGTPQDENASIQVSGQNNLRAGIDNEIKVICTAENGAKKEYTIIAKRAAAHGASEETTNPITEEIPDTTETDSQTTVGRADDSDIAPKDQNHGGVSGWLTFFLCIITLGLGFGGGYYFRIYYAIQKRSKKPQRRRLM